MKEDDLVYLMLGQDSSIKVLGTKPDNVEVDLSTNEWWETNFSGSQDKDVSNWRGKTPIGGHRLFYVQHMPNRVFGVYDSHDPKQLEAMINDARSALVPHR
jgi:hypothetical protein